MTTPFEQSTREWLRAGAEGLDGRVRSRLNRARHAALEELSSRTRWRVRLLGPVSAAVGAAAVALVLWWMPSHQGRNAPAPAAAVAMAIDEAELAPLGGEGLLDADPTLFALASLQDAPQ